nr:hypothetical protein [Tanacetum cinerariifolium]
MSSVTAQQTKLDLELELIPKKKRLETGKCNGRLNPGKKQREPTFQVVLDALALTLCYSSFLTTADVLEKKFDFNLEIFRDIFHICPRVHGQNFDEPPTDKVIVSFFKELGHTREIKSITNVVVDQMHQPWRTFATIINISLSRKTTDLGKLRLPRIDNKGHKNPEKIHEMRETKAYKTYLGYAAGVTTPKKAQKFKKPTSPKIITVPVSPKEPTRKSKKVKRPAKKSTNAPTAVVVIRDTPVMSLSKKKENMSVEKRKEFDFLSKVALTKEAQYEEVRKKSLRDFHKTYPSVSGIVTTAVNIKPFVTNEGPGAKPEVLDMTEEESNDSEAESWGREEDDSNNDRDSTEGDEHKGMEYTTNQFDDDVDVRLNEPVNTDEGFIQKEGTNAEMINIQKGNENLEAAASLIEFELKKILIEKIDEIQSYLTATEYKECYDGLIKSYNLYKSLFSTYDKVYSLKRNQKDKDKDEDPSVGSDRGLKKRKTSKDAEPTKGPKTKESKSGSSKCTKSQSKSSKKFVHAEEPKFKITNLTQETLLEPAFKLLKGTHTNFDDLEYDFEECYKALSEKLNCDNPEGDNYPFDLTKPLPLVINGNRQIVLVDYFFNNDLKYLQGEILTMTYTTSITKTKVAQYDIPGIEDMVLNIWSLVKFAYDKHAIWVTRVEVMQKHGYRYLSEIEVRRADKDFTHSRKATSHDCVSMTSRTC